MLTNDKIKLVERFLGELVCDGKIAIAADILDDDFCYVTPSTTFYGREDYLLYLDKLRESWNELKIVPQKIREEKNEVIAEVKVTAVPVKSFLGLMPTFKPFTLPASCVFKFERNCIKSMNANYSVTELLDK